MQFKLVTFATKALDPEAGIYELMPSAESEDRDQDILLATGARLDNFRRNPVVMYAHGYSELPVAKALSIEPVPGKGLKATIQFPPKGVSAQADTVHGLWAGGFLNAASVGFIPEQWANRPGPNGEPAPPDDSYNAPFGRIYTSWELLEFSIVPVPANADALRLSMFGKRGRVLSAANEERIRSAVKALGEVLDQLGQEPEQDAVSESEQRELADSVSVLFQSMTEVYRHGK